MILRKTKKTTKKPVQKIVRKKVAAQVKKEVKSGASKKRALIKKEHFEIMLFGKTTAALVKHKENPIILPNTENDWESWQTFNPTAILLDDKVHFLYRAIGQDGISRLGYAASSDGLTIEERLTDPVYQHPVAPNARKTFNIYSYFSGGSFGGAEDPRIVRVEEEGQLYLTYTACDQGLRVALTSIGLQDFLDKKWSWQPPVLISPPGEVHKNWVIFPKKINGKYAILHSINPEISIDYFDSLDELNGFTFIQSRYSGERRKNHWDSWVRGVGPAPLYTKHGWLIFYHAMSANDFSKYKVGAMLLDLNDPTKILVRSRMPVLEPSEAYENNGFKAEVVYASGAVVKDGALLVYYGGSDSYVCVAVADLEEFIISLQKGIKPALRKKALKKPRLTR